MEHQFKDLEDKENERRKAMGLPPLPKRAWKKFTDWDASDIEEYTQEVKAASKAYKDPVSQKKFIDKAMAELASLTGKRKVKPKLKDSVIIVTDTGTSSSTVEDIAAAIEQSTRAKAKRGERDLQRAAPVLSDLHADKEDRIRSSDQDDPQSRTIGQKLDSFQRDVFRRSFPILSKVIESFEDRKKLDSRDKSRAEMRERRVLDKTEQTAIALASLSREQERSVDLLRDLLDAVRQLSQQGQGSNVPGIRGRLGRSVRALGRALPLLLGGAAVAGGAYGLYRLMQDGDEPASQEAQELAQRVSFDYDSELGTVPKDSTAAPAAKGPSIDLSGALKSISSGSETSEPMVKSPISGGSAGTYLPKAPAMPTDLGAQLENPAVESLSRDLALRATRVTLRGGEIQIAGAGQGPGGGKSAAAGDLSFASGVDQRINDNIAQKLERVESDSGQDLLITSGFRDQSRNRAAGGASDSAHTRGNAVDVRFAGNEQDTAAVIESAKKAGIGGIGVYGPGMLHLDTEASRAWGPDHTSRSIPEWAKPALDGKSIGPSATAVPSGGGMGAAVMGASQENALAERTPMPPTVITAESTETGFATPGLQVPSTGVDPTDPGNVEPEDAAERYAKLFNMAA